MKYKLKINPIHTDYYDLFAVEGDTDTPMATLFVDYVPPHLVQELVGMEEVLVTIF